MDPADKVDRDATTPFLLKVFYRTGAFHRPDEFSAPDHLAHVSFHTWPSATLAELSQQFAAVAPNLLPSPAIGTRLAFRLLYYDTRAAGDQDQAPARCVVKDLGSVVVGDGGPGISTDADEAGGETEDGRLRMGATLGSAADSARSLADARFVVGDYLSCAILPPSSADGSVQPASAARAGRGYGAGQARSVVDPGPPPMSRGRDGWSATTYGTRGGGGGGGNFRAPPVGEWRRGEKLPEGPPGRGRGGRRW
ncbi:hypothetical protein Daus18300_001341 [Diaporthe australafricana]|uniref:Sin3-associated polypeptide Sap18 n=1 Tax=Diaporthe australafricana TaxID=127596 RepID=A0ABR3XXJ8_9PEZI